MAEFRSWRSYRDFERKVKQGPRYIRSEELEEFLQCIRDTSAARKISLMKDRILWRAQSGFRWRTEVQDGNEFEVEDAYAPERMKPKADLAIDGRVNPRGIPCLYLATDKNTAMAEVRPSLGSFVSLGQFQVIRDLKLIDCSVEHARQPEIYFDEPDANERSKVIWTEIDHSFSEPVNHGDTSADYVPTQILSEVFRQIGFDGIGYKSRFVKEGFNIALFDVGTADLINCQLHKAINVAFDFEQAGNMYYVSKYYEKLNKRR